MVNGPLITIVIATRNSECYINECLCSLRPIKSDLTSLVETIVIDGASTDSTLEIVRNSGVVDRVIAQSSKGLYEALNEGVELAKGRSVMFVHSDDKILRFDRRVIERLPSEDILVGDVTVFRSDIGKCFTRRLARSPKGALNVFPFVFHPNAIYPTRLLRTYPYLPSHGRKADMYQLALVGGMIKFFREGGVEYGFRLHEKSTTVRGVAQDSESFSYWFWRVYVFAFFEDNRWLRIRRRLRGEKVWNLEQ